MVAKKTAVQQSSTGRTAGAAGSGVSAAPDVRGRSAAHAALSRTAGLVRKIGRAHV